MKKQKLERFHVWFGSLFDIIGMDATGCNIPPSPGHWIIKHMVGKLLSATVHK
jgi:hypothetical protein